MMRSPLHQQIDSLPELVAEMIDPLIGAIQAALPEHLVRQSNHLFLTGCGDSHHAVLGAELAFHQLAGLPAQAMSAMQLARYKADFLPKAESTLVLAVSVSGEVTRTVEALALTGKAGATTVALTGNRKSRLAKTAGHCLAITVPPLPDELAGLIVPGVRSYAASQLALYLTAVHLGQLRGRFTARQARRLRQELGDMAEQMAGTIARCDPVVAELAERWQKADQFVFCGAGPNYGAALFSAAKILEASGDPALGQDMEEWAHLQYFGRQVETPTLLLSAGGRDEGRTLEVATAAQAIGRQVALAAPEKSRLLREVAAGVTPIPLAAPLRESFSPLVTSLPGALLAAYRAQQLNEPYFRDFGGGRSREGGGGISRIRTGQQLEDLPS